MIAIKADSTKMANEERQIEDSPCDVTFAQDEHITTIPEDKTTFQCKICSVFFSRKNNLHVHIHKVHNNLSLTCDVCDNPLTNKKASRNSSDIVQTASTPYKCEKYNSNSMYCQ